MIPLVFCILGFYGCFVTRYNVLILLITIEVILLNLNFALCLTSCYLDDIVGFFFYFFILSIAGADAVIGLSFIIIFYRLRGILNLRYLNSLKG
jgi:NADH-ubiquinone oxidoreductase chain 4L